MQQKKFHTDFYVEVKMIPKLHLQVLWFTQSDCAFEGVCAT